MPLEALSAAIDELLTVDPADLASAESVVGLERDLSRLEALVSRVVAAFSSGGEWADDGSKDPAAWLRSHCRMANRDARRQVRNGRASRRMPRFEQALADGRVSRSHLDAVDAVLSPRTEPLFLRDEELLLGQATSLSFTDFQRALRYWEQHADPDGCEAAAEARRCRRSVTLAQTFDGVFHGSMNLDEISGSIVAGELDRIERALFEQDWAEAIDRLGRTPQFHELARTAPQRRADALVEMASRSAAVSDRCVTPRPLLSVFVGYETLQGRICELANGTVVTPGSLLQYLDRAMIERAVFTPENRVEVSEKSRFFVGATRRAVQLRDRRCSYPGCEAPIDRCEVDHIVPYSKGGRTIQVNGRLRCRFHNRGRNNGLDDITPPAYQPPRRE